MGATDIFITLLIAALVQSTLASYRATAIEHVTVYATSSVKSDEEAAAIMHQNLDILEVELVNAAAAGSDLVVFPEMALTSLTFSRVEMAHFLITLPEVGTKLHVGDNFDGALNNHSIRTATEVLTRVATMAVNNGVYLVFNWGDRFPCPADVPCPPDGHLQYNTELAVDPAGTLVAKYYKLHTFNATEFDSPPVSDPVYFNMTTAGVVTKIGLMVCFDSMFARPVVELMRFHGVTDFAVSHWWVNQNALMNAVTWFQAVSRTYGVNLIVAASVWDKIYPWGSGSGIFSAGQVLQSAYRVQHKNVSIGNDIMLTALVPTLEASTVTALPALVQYRTITEPPLPMCVQSKMYPAAGLRTGDQIHAELSCMKFSCNISATVGAAGLNSTGYWVAFADYGFYHMHDGNGVYYFEQFCSFYWCYDDSKCLDHAHHIDDDYAPAAARWTSVRLAANLYPGAVPFAMASDLRANVVRDPMQTLRYTQGVWSNQQGVVVTSEPTVLEAVPGSHDEGLLNLSLLGRLFSADEKLGNTQGWSREGQV